MLFEAVGISALSTLNGKIALSHTEYTTTLNSLDLQHDPGGLLIPDMDIIFRVPRGTGHAA